MSEPPRRRISGATHRLISSRYPTIGVFDEIARTAQELRDAFLLESLTNDRLSLPAKRLALLPDAEIARGPTGSLIMAAFLHANPEGGRFTDGRLGAWYASLERETAVAETVHHHTRRLKASAGGFPQAMQMRQLIAAINGDLIDLRAHRASLPRLFDTDDYACSRAFGLARRWPQEGEPAKGLIYGSVRQSGGVNVCLYSPTVIEPPVRQAGHLEYRWDAAGDITIVPLTS